MISLEKPLFLKFIWFSLHLDLYIISISISVKSAIKNFSLEVNLLIKIKCNFIKKLLETVNTENVYKFNQGYIQRTGCSSFAYTFKNVCTTLNCICVFRTKIKVYYHQGPVWHYLLGGNNKGQQQAQDSTVKSTDMS